MGDTTTLRKPGDTPNMLADLQLTGSLRPTSELPTIQELLRTDAFTVKAFCHQSNSEDRDRVGWPDHQGWQVDSPVVTSSRNQCIG